MDIGQRDSANSIRDSKGQIILLKSQKLASVIYLITGFVSDADPIKWDLRKLSLKIASETDPLDLSKTITNIGQMINLIDIALQGQAVSQMNFAIVRQEYLSLRTLAVNEQVKHSPLQQVALSPVYPPARLGRTPSLAPSSSPVKSRLGDDREEVAGTSIVTASSSSSQNQSRQELILKFIREKGWSSIKEIAQAVPQVSSKTVQRELVELLRLGQLKREGDRRWSRYQLLDRS